MSMMIDIQYTYSQSYDAKLPQIIHQNIITPIMMPMRYKIVGIVASLSLSYSSLDGFISGLVSGKVALIYFLRVVDILTSNIMRYTSHRSSVPYSILYMVAPLHTLYLRTIYARYQLLLLC